MINEIIFLLHVLFITSGALAATWAGSEALTAFITLQAILANLFVTKQITLFGLTATGTDAFMIGASLGLNLLQEWYGKAAARRAISISFGFLVFYTLATIIHLNYAPAADDIMHGHFQSILDAMPRITIASLCVYLFVQYLEYYTFGLLTRLFGGNYLSLRNIVSIGICQFVDTVLFSFLALYGIVSNVLHIIIISYSIKLITIFISTSFVGYARTLLPQRIYKS